MQVSRIWFYLTLRHSCLNFVHPVDQTEACDVIFRLSAEDNSVVLVRRVIEHYHNCLKCVNDDNEIDPATIWDVYIDGTPVTSPELVTVFNGTLLLQNATLVIPQDGRDVDVIANCYTPDQSINRNFSLYSDCTSAGRVSVDLRFGFFAVFLMYR